MPRSQAPEVELRRALTKGRLAISSPRRIGDEKNMNRDTGRNCVISQLRNMVVMDARVERRRFIVYRRSRKGQRK